MNTKIYKAVHNLAGDLMKAAHKNDQVTFDALYAELKFICDTHAGTDKDHPVQWETLADFTEELPEAVGIYQQAFELAVAQEARDFIASIGHSVAVLELELGERESAVAHLTQARVSAKRIEDRQLRGEINNLLTSLEEQGK